ncbi:MFS transporter [Nocardioides montaniterrae]
MRPVLAIAAIAVAFAAIDTYVVVLALPDMMSGVGLSVEQLQRAAPIVSGFLLGYVAILPLIGRIADLRGPVPVLVASLVVFALGSLLTAISSDLTSLVVGRFLQGVGGGGLVPATLAMVAALYPPESRGLPLGLVSAVQEIGSVLGPLYGALVLAAGPWRLIFGINLVVGLVLAGVLRMVGFDTSSPSGSDYSTSDRRRRRPDLVGVVLAAIALGATFLVYVQVDQIKRDLTWGQIFIPYADHGSAWLTPIGSVAMGGAVLFVAWCLVARRPLVDLRAWGTNLRDADLRGALLLAIALAGIVLAFATADPKVAVFAPQGWWYLLGSAVAGVLLVLHLRTAKAPIIPRGALRRTPAWGSLVVSFLVGFALIAALVDIPLFARTTVYPDSQLKAALVLLAFLVGVPVGAVAGGWLLRHLGPGPITAIGMLLAADSFFWMSSWGMTTLAHHWTVVPLFLGGLGFGLALAPVNAAMLVSTPDDTHGLASALVVVARMIGMLVGISALTTIGLRRLYAARDAHPSWDLDRLGILQEHAVFLGAGVVALTAGAVALPLLRAKHARGVDLAESLLTGG